jgi:hypothetical protein
MMVKKPASGGLFHCLKVRPFSWAAG